MIPRLAAYVHVADERGEMHVFGPADRVPEWAARRIVNPKAWEGGEAPYPYDAAAERKAEADRLRKRLAELEPENGVRVKATEVTASTESSKPATDAPPPKGGAGSGVSEWRAYAARKGVEVPDIANRDDVIAALTAAGVPTE